MKNKILMAKCFFLALFSVQAQTPTVTGWNETYDGFPGGMGIVVNEGESVFTGNFISDDLGEEILIVEYTGDLVLYDFNNLPSWNGYWTEVNRTTSSSQSHAYLYDEFVVGDYNGDGVDEILAVDPKQGSGGWLTKFVWNGTKWAWNGSNYGELLDVYKAKHDLIAGDFDNDGKDELFGYYFENGSHHTNLYNLENFQFPSGANHTFFKKAGGRVGNWSMIPLIGHLHSGDLNGDGDDEIMGWDNDVRVYNFIPQTGGMEEVFSNHHTSSDRLDGSWIRTPLATNGQSVDQVFLADVDWVDANAEICYFETSSSNNKHNPLETWQFDNSFDVHKRGYHLDVSPDPFLAGEGGKYFAVKALDNEPSFIFRVNQGETMYRPIVHTHNLREASSEITTDEIKTYVFPTTVLNETPLTINGGDVIARVEVLSVEGEQLMSELGNNTAQLSLKLTNLNSGMYIAKVTLDHGKIETLRFTKQ